MEIPLGTLSGKKRKAEEGSNGIMSRAKYSSTPSPSRSPDRQTSVNIVGPSPHIRYDVVSYGSSQPQIYQADGQVWAQGAVPTLLTAPSSGYAQPFSYIVHPQGASTGATYSLYGPASGNLFGNHGTYVYQPQQVQHPHLTHLYPQSGYGVPNLSSSGSSSVQAQSALYGSSNGVQPSSQDHDEADMELSMSLYAQGNGTASAVASRSIDENSSVIFGSGSGLDSNGATVPPTVTSSVDASAYNYAYPSAYSTLDSNSSQPMSVYPAEVSRQAPPPDSSAANSNMYPPDPYTGTSPLEPQTSDLQSTQT